MIGVKGTRERQSFRDAMAVLEAHAQGHATCGPWAVHTHLPLQARPWYLLHASRQALHRAAYVAHL